MHGYRSRKILTPQSLPRYIFIPKTLSGTRAQRFCYILHAQTFLFTTKCVRQREKEQETQQGLQEIYSWQPKEKE